MEDLVLHLHDVQLLVQVALPIGQLLHVFLVALLQLLALGRHAGHALGVILLQPGRRRHSLISVRVGKGMCTKRRNIYGNTRSGRVLYNSIEALGVDLLELRRCLEHPLHQFVDGLLLILPDHNTAAAEAVLRHRGGEPCYADRRTFTVWNMYCAALFVWISA